MSEQEQTLEPVPEPVVEPVPVVPVPEPVPEDIADNQEDDINISNPVDNEPNSEVREEDREEDREDSDNNRSGGLSTDQVVQLISDNLNGNYMDKINSLTGQLSSHQELLQSHADQLRRFTQTGRAFYGTAHQIINGNM